MAKGKYKQSALKRIELGNIEELNRKVEELTLENEQLKRQADQDHQQHAYQIAQMYEKITGVASPRIQELEAEVLRLKKALRGAE